MNATDHDINLIYDNSNYNKNALSVFTLNDSIAATLTYSESIYIYMSVDHNNKW